VQAGAVVHCFRGNAVKKRKDARRKSATMSRSRGLAKNVSDENSRVSAEIHEAVRERLTNCPYAYYFSKVSWRCTGGTLTLAGEVPTFHLKQILQTILRDLEQVERIENDVDVVSSTGLSSERSAGTC
jgi:osmotically-inducible protein OsmY